MSKRKQRKLGMLNQAKLNAAKAELAAVMRERAKSGANGTHLNKAEKRSRTRSSKLRKVLKEEMGD